MEQEKGATTKVQTNKTRLQKLLPKGKSLTIVGATTLIIMTLSRMTLSRMTLRIMTLRIMTLRIMTLITMTLSIICLFATLRTNDTKYNYSKHYRFICNTQHQ
jgi:hypothetical protein